jgi:hypothetical protein|tara:strand:- start:2805 stop:2924 length:120 start_codon:yes stop_codon:yes gene_type:complete
MFKEMKEMIRRWGGNPTAKYTIHAVLSAFALGFLLGVLL